MRPLQALAVAALLLANLATSATAQTVPWPNHAQGRALPRPSWVLAIPARRNADGSLTIWDRADEWTRSWRVPQTVNGLRIVTLLGDTEDRRSITPDAIDSMLVDQMRPVLSKYGAPALALAVNDGTSVAVAGYVPGSSAAWDWSGDASSIDEAHASAIGTIAELFSGEGAPAPAETTGTSVRILAYRQNPQTGGLDYRLTTYGDGAAVASTLNAVPGTAVVNLEQADDGSWTIEIQRAPEAPEIEVDLARYGVEFEE